MLEKRALSLDDLEAQTAVELPERNMLALINVIITNVANGLSVNVNVSNVNVAVQVCALVSLLDTILIPPDKLTCSF